MRSPSPIQRSNSNPVIQGSTDRRTPLAPTCHLLGYIRREPIPARRPFVRCHRGTEERVMFIPLTLMACQLTGRPPDNRDTLRFITQRAALHADIRTYKDPNNDPANESPNWKNFDRYPWLLNNEDYQIRFEKHQVCVRYKTTRRLGCVKRSPKDRAKSDAPSETDLINKPSSKTTLRAPG